MTREEATEQVRKVGVWSFWKVAREATGPDGEMLYPVRTRRLAYAGEVAVILGRQGRDIDAGQYRDFVGGVTFLADWSIRDGRESAPLTFAAAKDFDTCLSMGPWIVVDELDPQDIEVETRVNEETRQRYNARDMVFSFGGAHAVSVAGLHPLPG